MVRFEVFDSTHGARTTRRRRIVGRGRMRRSGFGAGIGGPYCLDAYICQGEIEIEKGRIRSIVLLGSVHKLG